MKLIPVLLLMLAPVCMQAQVITTYAGNGVTGYSGDGGPATAAQFQELVGVAVDTAGNVYIPDYNNNVIRKVNKTTRIITTIAGNGTPGYSGDGGPATAAQMDHPWNVAVDISGAIYIAERGNNLIRKVSASGIISTFAGNGTIGYSGNGGPATAATFNRPWGIAIGANNVYITDGGNDVVRSINSSGIVTTIAGNGTLGYNGDGIPAISAELSNPAGIALYGGDLYIADNLNNRIRKVNASGIITTVAGIGSQGYTGDGGAATSAAINNPQGICADAAGNIYFSDFGNNVARKITGAAISTIAGNGTYGYSGDEGNPLLAQLYQPWGIAVDKANRIYIADKNNYRVRQVYTPAAGTGVIARKTFSVHPNPVTDILTIVAEEQINSVRIINLLGQEVYIMKYSAYEVQADVSALPHGIYLLNINNTISARFIKQ
jgi:sugar lactone lactonase YvrE